jgi:hypothetical protein
MKLTVFLLIFSLAFCAAGDDEQEQQEMHPDAQAIVNAASNFVSAHSQDLGGLPSTYLQDLNDLVDDIPADADLSNFDVDTYVSSIDNQTNAMLANMTGNAASLKEEYLEEVANFFIKEYCKDMGNGVDNINASDYIADLARLNASFQGRADALNSPPPSGNGYGYDPENYLDKASGATQRDSKFDFLWAGIEHKRNGVDKWNLLGKNLVSMINAFQTRFAHDAVAQNDFQFLLDLWPQSAEAYTMNTAYDDGVYYLDRPDDSTKQNSYVMDEYGYPTSDYDSEDFNVGGNSTRYITQSYNNRQWGYTNGTFDMVTVTTNGRKYSLAENFYTSPIILDLDGDGAIQASGGKWLPHEYKTGTRLAEFDMNGDGFPDLTEWVGPQDGLLMVYDGNGKVSGKNLFGNAGGFDDGYEKLLLLDKNHDNMLTGEETVTLSVWQDLNMNAQVEKGEVSSLKDLGITMLSVNCDDYWVSHYIQNGEQKKMFDWYPTLFVIKRTE